MTWNRISSRPAAVRFAALQWHPMPPHLRPCVPTDVPALFRIDQACFARGIAYSKAVLRWYLSLPGAVCLVAEVKEAVAGFILASSEADKAHLITLDVLAPYRRQGLGTLLLDTVESGLAARGVQAIELETATNNQPAIAFWQKHGYRTVGVLPHYYLGHIDANFMRKLLPAPRET